MKDTRENVGRLTTCMGDVPVVTTKLNLSDRLGSWKARWGIGRMRYSVSPGLYAVGEADAGSPVFVSSNYKMSFDRLRQALDGFKAWILVLDTKGINVWCAAGKGTFGTDEIVRRTEAVGLSRLISHKTLILPQLGAPGVAAHEVTRRSGFRVVYGPVRAADIKAFMDAGMKTSPDMRRVTFKLKDRIILTPIDLVGVVKHPAFLVIFGLWLLKILGLKIIAVDLPAVLGAVIMGTLITPIGLPWIPGRALSWKGWLMGLIWAAAVCAYYGLPAESLSSWTAAASYVLILPAVSAFLALTFTGTTTYTSLSGVVREMKFALPLIIVSAVLGLAAMIAGIWIKP